MIYHSEYSGVRLVIECRLFVYHAYVMPPAHNDN